MRDRDLPNRCDDPSIMSSQPEPLPSTPRKKRPIFEAFARVTDSASKKGTRTPGAKRPRGAKLNFVDDEGDEDGEVFVPEATNKLLEYAVAGEKDLPAGQKALAAFVERVADVPRDFAAQHRYGPKSGVSHEERLLGAYAYGLLDGGADDRKAVKQFVQARDWEAAAAWCAARADERERAY